MVSTASTMNELGTAAPAFSLPNTNPNVGDRMVSLDDYSDARALLVAFVCNHCPYVIHIRDAFVEFTREFQDKGLAVVAISANDIATHPDDSPEKMQQDCEQFDYPFAYLFDETQSVAKAYRAACTPDFFLYNSDHQLVYRGQFDGSRPKNDVPVTGEDMRAAVNAVLTGEPTPAEQIASIGCNIKWKAGNEPDYF